jgi:hypothetical protein
MTLTLSIFGEFTATHSTRTLLLLTVDACAFRLFPADSIILAV